jgi:hypothetical protein
MLLVHHRYRQHLLMHLDAGYSILLSCGRMGTERLTLS